MARVVGDHAMITTSVRAGPAETLEKAGTNMVITCWRASVVGCAYRSAVEPAIDFGLERGEDYLGGLPRSSSHDGIVL